MVAHNVLQLGEGGGIRSTNVIFVQKFHRRTAVEFAPNLSFFHTAGNDSFIVHQFFHNI
jgi:hypothetical protein